MSPSSGSSIAFRSSSPSRQLVYFNAARLGLDAGLIELYRKRQPTIFEHQQTIADYLRLRPFDDAAVTQLEQFLFEEAAVWSRLAPLRAGRGSFLKSSACSSPPSSGSPASSASSGPGHASIVTRIADSFPSEIAKTINRLLDIQPGETVSALQKIKANPAKSSAPAMNALKAIHSSMGYLSPLEFEKLLPNEQKHKT